MKQENGTYIVFARKWRPQTFEEVVGQETVRRQLANALAEGRIANAYLFAGPRGVGKTSIARILAKALNCRTGITPTPCNTCNQCLSITQGSSMDVIEIDGASYTGVDDIRELQEGVNRASFSARKKVYIIDEVHMLSKSAFNALLKTLEEPPLFVVFIFATTEIEKIPETIRSRCQIFMFERISTKEIIGRLDLILTREKGVKVNEAERAAILEAIASGAEGGMRDAEVMLEQLISLSGGNLKFEYVSQLLGLVEFDLLIGTVRDLSKRDIRSLLERVAHLVNKGRDLERFIKTMLGFLRDLLIQKAGVAVLPETYSAERMKEISDLLESISLSFLLNTMNNFFALEERVKSIAQTRFLLEFVFIRLCAIQTDVDIDSILERLENMEKGISSPAPRGMDYAPPPPTLPQLKRDSASMDLFNGQNIAPNPTSVAEEIPGSSAFVATSAKEAIEVAKDDTELASRFKKFVLEKRPLLAQAFKVAAFQKTGDDIFTIRTPEALWGNMLSRSETVAFMQEILSRLGGKPIRVKVEISSDISPAAPASGQVSTTPPAPPIAEPQDETPLDVENEVLPLPESEGDAVAEGGQMEERPDSVDMEAEQYRHLLKDKKVSKRMVIDLLKQNEDIKDAVDAVQKMFDAKLTHLDGKKIT
ncbi:MAG: DNA polymerase III subunit gamma/tau [Candidatus Sumerlaeota bacterium]|nr:DNA polymerase III subunit gamma/tau [Candidatus Sumerlaeota bacterium]